MDGCGVWGGDDKKHDDDTNTATKENKTLYKTNKRKERRKKITIRTLAESLASCTSKTTTTADGIR